MNVKSIIQNSVNTVRSMFGRRGYVRVSKLIKASMDKVNVVKITAEYTNPRNGRMEYVQCVWIPFNYNKMKFSIGKSEIIGYCATLKADEHLIIIADSVSFQAVEHMNTQEFYWEILSYSDVSFDCMLSVRVPNYTIMPPQEVKAVEAVYGNRDRFPRIIAGSDPVARFMDFRVGDLLRVIKYSPIAGECVYYRLVTHADHMI